MNVRVYKPKSELLSQLIDCFYLLDRTDNETNTVYLTFPSTLTIHTINFNTKIKSEGVRYKIYHDETVEVSSSLVCRFKSPFCFEYEGQTSEITIYYKPLGINAFLEEPLEEYAEGILSDFIPFSDLESTFKEVLFQSDEEKILNLEKYLLTKYRGFNHPYLNEFVDDLKNENLDSISISNLADKYGVTQKTVIRHFEKYLCKTPSEFRKIVRFRKALDKFNQQTEKLNLTELSYILNYFDQSHLIKEFKSLTGYTPKQFFSKITPMGEAKINWMFLT